MSPHSKNYLLIFLFLATIVASSIAWQKYTEVKDLTDSVQNLSRQLAQSRAMAARSVRQPTTIINNTDLSATDPTAVNAGRARRGLGGNGRRNGGGGGFAGGGGG